MSTENAISPALQIEIITNILDELNVRVSYWDTNQICLYTNRIGLNWFGKSQEEVVGHSAKEVFGSPLYEQNLPYFLKALKGDTQTFERDIISSDREAKSLLVTYSPSIVAGQVKGVIISVTDVTSLKKIEQELKVAKEKAEVLATHDYLTGLPNRVLLDDRINRGLSLAKRTKSMASLLTLDIDGFKQINDTYGHQMGDVVLKLIAKQLTELVRETDTIARLGGDEFVLLATQVKSITNIKSLANRILKIAKKPFVVGNHELRIGISIGIACYPSNGLTAKTLMKNSDKALYAAKARGKNCYFIWGAK